MLSCHVRQAGLLDRRLRYYAWKITLTALALAAGWTAFAVLGDSWWQLGTAVFLAAVFAQIGFLGHDAGPYCQATLLGSYAQALRHLNAIGKLTRPAAVTAAAPALTPP